MRVNSQALNESLPLSTRLGFVSMRRPNYFPPECPLKVPDGQHADCIGELLVKFRVALIRILTIRPLQAIQINRIVEAFARWIVVHDLHILAHRTNAYRFPWNSKHDFIHPGGVELLGQPRVKRISAQASPLRVCPGWPFVN